MATACGWTVQVEHLDGSPYTLFGTRSRGNTVVSNIEAKDGAGFCIRVKPENPFPEARESGEQRSRYNLRSQPNAMDVDQPETPWKWFANIYMDGKKEAEDDSIVYTDPRHEHYEPDGVLFQGRAEAVVDESSGDIGFEHDLVVLPWIFTQQGIDTLISRMDIHKPTVEVPSSVMEQDVADISQAMASDSLSEPSRAKRGNIEIVIERCITGEKIRPSSTYRAEEVESENTDGMYDVSYDEANKHYFYGTTVETSRYRADEAFYAKFVIQYHDRTKLIGMGLCARDGTAIEKRPLPAASASTGSPGSLKRLRDCETDSGEALIDVGLTSDDESVTSDSDTDSDSDVPRRKRQAIPGLRTTKPRKKMTPRMNRNAIEPLMQSMVFVGSTGRSVPESDFDFKNDHQFGSDAQAARKLFETEPMQLAIANTPEAGGNQLIMSSNEVAKMTDTEKEMADKAMIEMADGDDIF